jgi:hypothetical protein
MVVRCHTERLASEFVGWRDRPIGFLTLLVLLLLVAFAQALMLMLTRSEVRGVGAARYEQVMHLHLVNCKEVPQDLMDVYWRLHM